MKIITWNVNGIRAVLKKDFLDFLKKEKPNILCLQETKIAEKDIPKQEFDFPDYVEYWNPAERPGYSGTAILVKNIPQPLSKGEISNGFGIEKFDKEGRVQTLELDKFYLVNAYFPNANHELSRLGYKIEFNEELLKYLKKLEKKKPVVICGDFNVAHEEIDLARPKDNEGRAGFTKEERAWMTKFLNQGFVDIFRKKYPKKMQYTWWSYRTAARKRNIGWRIDYFCVSDKLNKQIKKIQVLDKILGSDHCPIKIEV